LNRIIKALSIVLSIALLSLLSGCVLTSQSVLPSSLADALVPSHWSAPLAEADDAQNQWLAAFASSELEALVTEGLVHNRNLQAAAFRISRSFALAKVSKAARLPDLNVALGANRSRANANNQSFYGSSVSLAFLTSWEADLWGKISSQVNASELAWKAVAADYQAARLSLVANISRAWFAVIAAHQQQLLAETNQANLSNTLAIVRRRYQQGLTSALDIELAESNYSQASNNRLVRQSRLRDARQSLELLLGRYPDASILSVDALPELRSKIPTGLPADLLIRRPDLRAALYRLKSLDQSYLATERARLPALRLTASGGTVSDALSSLTSVGGLVWNLGANLSAPLFDAGRLKSEAEASKASTLEGLANYEQVLLVAFREVEQALSEEVLLGAREESLMNAVNHAVIGEEIAKRQYQGGLIDVLSLLDTQQLALTMKSQQLDVQQARLDNRVKLHLALGGSFVSAVNIEEESTRAE